MSLNAVLGCNLQNDRMISVHFQGKSFNKITVIQVYAPTSNAEEAAKFRLQLKKVGKTTRPFKFSFFSVTGWHIGLDYRDIEWFALETSRDHSVVFELHPSTAFQSLLLTIMATPFLLRDSCPQ